MSEYTPLLSSSDIERINSIQKQWVAKENRFTRMSLEDAKKMFEATPLRPEFNSFPDLKFKRSRFETEDHLRQTPIPTSFDASVQWPLCVVPIGNHGSCNASYAFSVTAVASERLCITNTALYRGMNLSPQYLVCNGGNGCTNTFVHDAWIAFASTGSAVATCLPWTGSTTCPSTCKNGTPVSVIKADPKSIYEAYSQAGIQQEIMSGGSVSSQMTVYADFASYDGGIYAKTSNVTVGIQVVKLFGWGVSDEGVKYWIGSNSVGTDWGINGVFWIQFGNCGVDAIGVIGLINLD